MEIQNYKMVGKGCLKSKFDVMVPQWQMTIRDLTLFEKEGKQWVTFPSRSYEGQDGGKKYFEFIAFPKEVRDRFQIKCLEMLKPMQPAQATVSSHNEEVPF